MKNKIALFFMAFLLSGCSHFNLYKIKYMYVSPPHNTYSQVHVPKPLNAKLYLGANIDMREEMCLNSVQEHQDAFYTLYMSRRALGEWVDKQEAIYRLK